MASGLPQGLMSKTQKFAQTARLLVQTHGEGCLTPHLKHCNVYIPSAKHLCLQLWCVYTICKPFLITEVYVWGRGEYGRLGLGDKGGSSRLRPCKVKAIEGHRVVQVLRRPLLF